MGKQKAVLEMLAQILHIRHLLLQQGLAECLGTLVLVVSIRGRIEQTLLSKATYWGHRCLALFCVIAPISNPFVPLNVI
uniref:Uncharacterized protein n=1 Tax=Gadus morhua TaxID=8049 RepID=A0A8C5AM51_GADMO